MKDDRQDRIKYPAPHWAAAEIKELRGQLAEAENTITLVSAQDRLREGIIELMEERERLLQQVVTDLVAAMVRYEMDAEDEPPYEHRKLMDRARNALAAAPADGEPT